MSALEESRRATQFLCPNLSEMPRARAIVVTKRDQLNEGKRACELLPVTKDSWDGPVYVTNLALIYVWVGEKDMALEQLSASVKRPGGLSYGSLKLDPAWDPLRGDPRFEQIVASLAPK